MDSPNPKGANVFPELIAFLFMSRDYGHRAHLRSQSYAQHRALGDFYSQLTEKIDALVECYQGRNGVIDIPVAELDGQTEPVTALQAHLAMIEGVRGQAIPPLDSALNNIVDEVVTLYLQTLYKLKFLR
jgi:hypothetical protein